jgi:hypothetical protein
MRQFFCVVSCVANSTRQHFFCVFIDAALCRAAKRENRKFLIDTQFRKDPLLLLFIYLFCRPPFVRLRRKSYLRWCVLSCRHLWSFVFVVLVRLSLYVCIIMSVVVASPDDLRKRHRYLFFRLRNSNPLFRQSNRAQKTNQMSCTICKKQNKNKNQLRH